MNYEVFTAEQADGTICEFITLFIDDNNAKTFAADESNSEFVAFSEANPDWNKV